MSEENKNSSLDILGIKPIGEAANTAVNKTFEGVQGFLKSVCMPALDEIGLLMRDKVRNWRLNNILKILEKAKGKLDFEGGDLQIQAHPRVALSIIDNGSLVDNEELQDLWAGLFASSCSKTGQEDENLIFVDILKQLTVGEAKILKYSCVHGRKIIHENGLIVGDSLKVECEKLIEITGISEIHRLDRELDHLRSLELIGEGNGSGGFMADDKNLTADISPTGLALNLFVKTQGHNDSPSLYWRDNLITSADRLKESQEIQAEKIRLQQVEQQQTEQRNS